MKKILLFAIVISVVLLLIAAPVLARAGGGGGGSGGGGKGGVLGLILYPLFLLYSIIVTFIAARRTKQCREFSEMLAKDEKYWNMDMIKYRVQKSFFKVQEAWTERDQDIAKEFMTPALYEKHKQQTDIMLRNHEKNVLQRINLIEANVVGIMDYNDDKKDAMWVLIHGSMVDYTINDEDGTVKSGNDTEPEEFKELWKFARYNGRWMLDEIRQKTDLGEMLDLSVFTEEH